jgi:predicted phage baseplate assembly protein
MNANVVLATHGETTQEVLGSGDAAQSFPRFTLRQKPLTYTLPPDTGELESSLEIRVDDVRWQEVPTFFGCGPKDRVYVVRHSDDGITTVQFGDGRQGARLPTGRENVRAIYRKGIGLDGIVEAEQLSLLLTQPLGVKSVINLLPPQGAEDPQSLEDSRKNASRTVLTLDRIVSLQDYEDFARDFPGVEKAHAVWTWNGQTRGVLLTLLGPHGRVISDTGQPAAPLRKSINAKGIPRVPIRIVSRPPSLFAVSGVVRVELDRLAIQVEADVKASLRESFSFSAREFGQGVARSEVIAVIQNVPGVAFVEITSFEKTALSSGGILTETHNTASSDGFGFLAATIPANGVHSLLAEPAELLILDVSSLSKLEVLLR